MAFFEGLETRSVNAASDLSTKQFYFVKLDSSGNITLAGNGDWAYGVLQNKPAAAGRAGIVAVAGVTKVVAGAAITAGTDIGIDSSGRAVPTGTGDTVVGIARDTVSNAGEIVSVELVPQGRAAAS